MLAVGTAMGAVFVADLLTAQESPPKLGVRPVFKAEMLATEPRPLQGSQQPDAKPRMPTAAPDAGPTSVEGRVLDLEGRPVSGATVAVKYVQSPPDGKLDAWIDEVKRLGKEPFGLPIMPTQGQAQPTATSIGRGLAISVLSITLGVLNLSLSPPRPAVTVGSGSMGCPVTASPRPPSPARASRRPRCTS